MREKAAREKKREEEAKPKELEMKRDPRLLAQEWADAISKDIKDARNVVLKLQCGVRSKTLISEINVSIKELEDEHLKFLIMAATTIEPNQFKTLASKAQRMTESMRPLYARTESNLRSIYSLRRGSKRARSEVGSTR